MQLQCRFGSSSSGCLGGRSADVHKSAAVVASTTDYVPRVRNTFVAIGEWPFAGRRPASCTHFLLAVPSRLASGTMSLHILQRESLWSHPLLWMNSSVMNA